MPIKVFNLRCSRSHVFEGWFASADDLETQKQRKLLTCPVCNCTEVVKSPSAPYIGTAPVAEEPVASTPNRQPAAMPSPEQLQAAFLKVAREIVAQTEDVGTRFADEARRIHYEEAPRRGIRGVASRDEAQALDEEGIAVTPLPFGALLKDPLQ